MTRKEFEGMTFVDGQFFDVEIGRKWETKRSIFVPTPVRISEHEYSEMKIIVRGCPRHGDFQVYKEFPYTEDGFESAKKFALKK